MSSAVDMFLASVKQRSFGAPTGALQCKLHRAVGACCNVRAVPKKFWCVWTATEVSATAATSAANRPDWPASAERPSAIKVAVSGAATTPVANDACARDSANASKSNN
jgi:hypothetical protein